MISLRTLTSEDLPTGLRLSTEAGWNQLPADWHRALALGAEGCFVAEWNGTPVGTATTCVFGDVAWVALVLVDPGIRGRGIGRALMSQALQFLDQRGVATIRLDATPLGQPLYEKLGFVPQYRLARFAGVPPTLEQTPHRAGTTSETICPPDRWGELQDLDQAVTRTNRRPFLQMLFEQAPEEVRAVWKQGRLRGFTTARVGRCAVQIGPCHGEAGYTLLASACHRHGGRQVYLDVPEYHVPAEHLAREQGLTVQRHLIRMSRGTVLQERVESMWCSSGPEKG